MCELWTQSILTVTGAQLTVITQYAIPWYTIQTVTELHFEY
jgi:hypothetical protein